VQDKLRAAKATIAPLLADQNTHVYICGLRQMEAGVEQAFLDIAREARLDWDSTRDAMREAGRYHVETY
jgi:benzoyl-CoA 2,3-dioxygenase component A